MPFSVDVFWGFEILRSGCLFSLLSKEFVLTEEAMRTNYSRPHISNIFRPKNFNNFFDYTPSKINW